GVREGMAGARGRGGAVPEHPPASTGRAPDIARVDPQIRAARRWYADQGTHESRIAGDARRRQPPLTHHPRRAIGIANHRLEEFGALDQPGLELGPFSRLDEKRHMAQRPRPFYTRWILVDAVEDAGIMQVAVGGSEAPIDFPRSH